MTFTINVPYNKLVSSITIINMTPQFEVTLTDDSWDTIYDWNIYMQLGFSVSKVTDKKSSWIMILLKQRENTKNDDFIKTEWN